MDEMRADGGHDVHESAVAWLGTGLSNAEGLGRQVLARDGRLHSVGDGGRENVRPLADGLRRDADFPGYCRCAPAQQLDCSGLVHGSLNHACIRHATILARDESTLACMETFGERLGYALELRGVARKTLAAVLGVSVQAVNQMINSPTGAMTAANTAKASRYLKVNNYWLATGEGDPASPEYALVVEEVELLLNLRDIARINPETYARLAAEMKRIAEGLRATDKLLRENHGVTGYTSPERAAEKLPVPSAPDRPAPIPDRKLDGISGFADLDDAPPAPKRGRK